MRPPIPRTHAGTETHILSAAYNWPQHRGTATAFPLSGFGLSAFFFATLGHLFLGDSTSDFLLLLAAGTVVLNGVSFFFLRLIPTPPASTYHPVPGDSRSTYSGAASTKLRKRASSLVDPSEFERTPSPFLHASHPVALHHTSVTSRSNTPQTAPANDADEHTAILSSRASTVSDYGRDEFHKHQPTLPPSEITGLALLKHVEFWQLFGMLGLLAGVGLMTINNIGNDAGALWRAYAPGTDRSFIRSREQMHVGLLSLMSCAGRISSGIGSDVLIKRLHASRFWCLFFSATVFILAQLAALTVTNPNFLFLVSGLTGLGYGALFGVFPALTADAFGVSGMSLNWGFMIFAPVLTGNVYNVLYGRILDANTPPGAGGECVGHGCYVNAYWLTLASSILGAVGALWCVRYERMKKMRRLRGGRGP